MVMAYVHLLAGEYDEALDRLEEVLSMPSPYNTVWVEFDPDWDPVRHLPRYKEIIEAYKGITF
ncbi:MAG: hypothetical protein ACE5GA_07510 [Candidatus Zixiibacteriota bacterium]